MIVDPKDDDDFVITLLDKTMDPGKAKVVALISGYGGKFECFHFTPVLLTDLEDDDIDTIGNLEYFYVMCKHTDFPDYAGTRADLIAANGEFPLLSEYIL